MGSLGRYHGFHFLFTMVLWYSISQPCIGQVNDIVHSAIVNVQPFCASNTSGTSHVMVVSDAPVFYSYAKCQGGTTYNSTEVDMAHQKIIVQFDGDHSKGCVFNKKKLSQTYTVEVFVVVGTGSGVLLDEQFYLITCTYDPHGSEESKPKDFSTGLSPAKDVTVNQGGVAKSVITLKATDIFGKPLRGALRMRTKIRLHAEMKDAAPGEISFHPLTCKATGGRNAYAIIVAGCGDGRVIRSTDGFITTGKKAVSPPFKTFRLRGARSVTFQCTYYICTEPCDGSSCMTRYGARKRRDTDELEDSAELEKESSNSTLEVLKAALVEKHLFSVTQEFMVFDEEDGFLYFDDPSEINNDSPGPEMDTISVVTTAKHSGILPLISGILSTVALGSLALAVYFWYRSKRTDTLKFMPGSKVTVKSYATTRVENENYEPGTRAPHNFKHLKNLY